MDDEIEQRTYEDRIEEITAEIKKEMDKKDAKVL